MFGREDTRRCGTRWKNIEGKNLVLSFYQDGKVGVKYGERPCPVKGVRIDAELKLIRVKYFDGNLKWKFKAGEGS